jgi:hypothetical protein
MWDAGTAQPAQTSATSALENRRPLETNCTVMVNFSRLHSNLVVPKESVDRVAWGLAR